MVDDQSPHPPENDSPKATSTGKKPFEPPRLTAYGDIATLTRAVGRTGIADGGHGSNARTRP